MVRINQSTSSTNHPADYKICGLTQELKIWRIRPYIYHIINVLFVSQTFSHCNGFRILIFRGHFTIKILATKRGTPIHHFWIFVIAEHVTVLQHHDQVDFECRLLAKTSSSWWKIVWWYVFQSFTDPPRIRT